MPRLLWPSWRWMTMRGTPSSAISTAWACHSWWGANRRRTPAPAATRRRSARAAAGDNGRPRVGPLITQNSVPTWSYTRRSTRAAGAPRPTRPCRPRGGGRLATVVYKRLRERGYEVFAVNPSADQGEGDPAYHDLRAIAGGVHTVVIATRPETAEQTIRECADLGIDHVWMHRAFGDRERVRHGHAVRPRARHHGDRRRLPVHVRPRGRPRPQGDAPRLHATRPRPKAGRLKS